MPLLPGARLGPYEILGPLGAGGMGEVYRAKDTRLGRDVAVKILPTHLSQQAEARERFEREARAISSLNHPHICSLYDVGREGDADYFVMELLDGETLASRLTRGPMKFDEALSVAQQIADALAAAHKQGIVHRDLKPGNVALTKSGAKVLDFGIAKRRDERISETATRTTPLTGQGALIGTVQYMAPEQLEGKPVEHRADLFAFGAVLYEMLTGKRAFEGSSQASVIAAILDHEPRPVSELIPATPASLDRVVKSCLSKNPDQRWQGAADLARELRWIAEEAMTTAATGASAAATARSMPAWTMVAVAVALVAVGGSAGFIARGGHTMSTNARSLRLTLVPQVGVTPSIAGTDIAAFTISPDGRYVTFAANDANARPTIWIRSLDGLDARPLAGTENAECPFWSPDSRSIAFFSGGRLKKLEIAGGPAVTLTAVQGTARSGSWNRDGVVIFSPEMQSGIFKISANGGQPVRVTTVDPSKQETTHRWARFLPDGKHFIYTVGSHGHYSESELNAIYAASLDDPTPKLLLRASSQAIYAAGQLLYLRGGTLVAQPFDLGRLAVSGDAKVIAERVHYGPAMYQGAFDVSDEGTVFYVRARNQKSHLFWQDRSGGRTGPIGEPLQVWSSIAISHDETRIAIGIMNQSTQSADVWLYDASGAEGVPFAADPALQEAFPVWSPDGTRIAFMTGSSGLQLAVKPVGGGKEHVLVESSDAWLQPRSWSPDANSILFDRSTFDAIAKTETWIVSTRGEPAPHKLIAGNAGVSGAQFSPDGRWILFMSDESGRAELYIQAFPLAGPRHVVSTGGTLGGAWTRGGSEIWYAGVDRKAYTVAVGIKHGTPVLGPPVERGYLTGASSGDTAPSGRALLAIAATEDDPTPLTILTNWPATLK